MEGLFSRTPLAALLGAPCTVCAVVLPRPADTAASGVATLMMRPPARRRRELPLLAGSPEPGMRMMAQQANVPVLDVTHLTAPGTLTALGELRPDVICVACFPRLLPNAVLRLARHGALNVHPSLLPAYRGPSPLFWIFHDGTGGAGVTVHLMDAGADTGDILEQTPLSFPDGISYGEAERLCAQEGARLLLRAVDALYRGTARPRRQPEVGATHAPFPRDGDFVVTPEWRARRAFNFIRGVAGWDRPVILQAGDTRVAAGTAVAFSETEVLPEPFLRAGNQLTMHCSPGTLTVTCPDHRST
jgi:methionyl-tRNA formyltransferase